MTLASVLPTRGVPPLETRDLRFAELLIANGCMPVAVVFDTHARCCVFTFPATSAVSTVTQQYTEHSAVVTWDAAWAAHTAARALMAAARSRAEVSR